MSISVIESIWKCSQGRKTYRYLPDAWAFGVISVLWDELHENFEKKKKILCFYSRWFPVPFSTFWFAIGAALSNWASDLKKHIWEKRSENQQRKRYIQLNAELQRIARRDKKAFFKEQCKEIEENNRMGKTRDLFKKIRDTKGNISCKDRHNKGQK